MKRRSQYHTSHQGSGQSFGRGRGRGRGSSNSTHSLHDGVLRRAAECRNPPGVTRPETPGAESGVYESRVAQRHRVAGRERLAGLELSFSGRRRWRQKRALARRSLNIDDERRMSSLLAVESHRLDTRDDDRRLEEHVLPVRPPGACGARASQPAPAWAVPSDRVKRPNRRTERSMRRWTVRLRPIEGLFTCLLGAVGSAVVPFVQTMGRCRLSARWRPHHYAHRLDREVRVLHQLRGTSQTRRLSSTGLEI
jgi:hypothetical protein